MRLFRTILSAILFIPVTFPATAQGSVSVEARIDSVMLWVGEQTGYHLEVSCDRDSKVVFPLFADTIAGGLEILPPVLTDTQYIDQGNRMVISQNYTVTCFDSALVYIPPVAVAVDGQEYLSNSQAVSFLVFDIPEGQEKEIFPPKQNMKMPLAFNELAWPLLYLAVLAGTVFVSVFSYRRYNDNKPIIKKIKRSPKVPAHVRALEAIEDLRKSGSAHNQDAKHYYTSLTDIVRTYINERFGFNATEMTSAEILYNLRSCGDRSSIGELSELLSTADMVKFAKAQPLLGENDRNLLGAMEFVKTTMVQETENTEPEVLEDTVIVEKRSKEVRTALLVAFILSVVASLGFAACLIVKLYYLFF